MCSIADTALLLLSITVISGQVSHSFLLNIQYSRMRDDMRSPEKGFLKLMLVHSMCQKVLTINPLQQVILWK